MVKDIAFSFFPAKDVAKLRDFYASALGFKFTGAFEEGGELKYDEAQVGNAWFAVMTADWADVTPGSGIAFEVDDIEATVEALKKFDVAAENIYDTPVCRLTSFRDPENNKVTLHQTTVPH